MNEPHWIELSMPESAIPDEIQDVVTELLAEQCGGIEMAEEAGESVIKAYLPDNDTGKASLAQIRNQLAEVERRNDLPEKTVQSELRIQEIEPVDWATNWKQFYHPLRIGQHFVVYPSWEQPENLQSDDHLILLDPGQAFGTGQHETTTICMRIMESLSLEGLRVADVGCGSGILSIAARLLGAGEIYGVDIDPVAAETARENLQKNRITENVHISAGTVTSLHAEGPFDLVIANIISEVLLDIGKELQDITANGGLLIWSGIIEEQSQRVEKYIASLGLNIRQRLQDGEWFGYLLTRK